MTGATNYYLKQDYGDDWAGGGGGGSGTGTSSKASRDVNIKFPFHYTCRFLMIDFVFNRKVRNNLNCRNCPNNYGMQQEKVVVCPSCL